MDGAPKAIGKDAIALAVKSGNVNIAGSIHMEVLDLSASSREAQLQHAETLRRFEAQQRARSIVVPTDIGEVKQKLRELGHPITLFGEGPADRRERLKEAIAALELTSDDLSRVQQMMNTENAGAAGQSTKSGQQQKETFYTRASDELIAFRIETASESFERAHRRLMDTRRVRESDLLQQEEDCAVVKLYSDCKKVNLVASQYADERPLSAVRSSSHGSIFASASLHPVVKVWDVETLNQKLSLVGHTERVTSLGWHSQAFVQAGPALLASAAADGCCLLWDTRASSSSSISETLRTDMDMEGSTIDKTIVTMNCVRKLQGHQGVVANCEFHPSGRVLGTAGHDYSWRLWDVETGKELLLQDGHIMECSVITFQNDGALVFTADWAGVGLLWDLRSGQSVLTFQGHIKKIVNGHFNPNGFQVASCGVDNMVRIWDLRKKKCGYCLPAHANIISDARYSSSGELLLTSSFDGTLKLWGTRDYRLLRVLQGHSGKVMECDFLGNDERKIVSAGFDRTVKIWGDEIV